YLFFNDPDTNAIYTLSLHDALPIYKNSRKSQVSNVGAVRRSGKGRREVPGWRLQSLYSARDDSSKILMSGRTFLCVTYMQELGVDRKSTRLNSSHVAISYAVFCLKK